MNPKTKKTVSILLWVSIGLGLLSFLSNLATGVDGYNQIYADLGNAFGMDFSAFYMTQTMFITMLISLLITPIIYLIYNLVVFRKPHVSKNSIVVLLVLSIVFFDLLGVIGAGIGLGKFNAQDQPLPAAASVEDRLTNLDKLLDSGAITKAEYDQKRDQIIKGI